MSPKPRPYPKYLEDLFRYEVVWMRTADGKVSDTVIENVLSWRKAVLSSIMAIFPGRIWQTSLSLHTPVYRGCRPGALLGHMTFLRRLLYRRTCG